MRNRILPISEPLSKLSIQERLEKAKPKEIILSSAVSGGFSDSSREDLYWDSTQGVWLPKMLKSGVGQ